MTIQRTLSIVKPDAVGKNLIGRIYSRFEENGLKIVAAKMKHLSREEAEGFYAVHKDRPFFAGLVEFMTSGPVMVQVLEGENAVAKPRTDGCDQSAGSRSGHDPCRFCRFGRPKRGARFGQRGKCRLGNCLLLRRNRNLPALNLPN